jgi:predicted RNase H-like HicB family nuclease
MTRHVILYSDEGGSWTAECLSLPDCVGRGENKADALHQVIDEIRRQLAESERDGRPVIKESFEILPIAI